MRTTCFWILLFCSPLLSLIVLRWPELFLLVVFSWLAMVCWLRPRME